MTNLEQIFLNKFDCYADVNAPHAMSQDRFVEVVTALLRVPSAVLLGTDWELCNEILNPSPCRSSANYVESCAKTVERRKAELEAAHDLEDARKFGFPSHAIG